MRLIFTGLLIAGVFISNAQDLISTGGDFFQMPSGSISFTIGEPIIETVGNENHNLTQGFQQSTRPFISDYNELDDIEIDVYPNPTTDIVKIELSERRQLDYQLYDLHGVMLQQDKISEINTTISLGKYYPSVYILKLIDNNMGSRTFQIVKK